MEVVIEANRKQYWSIARIGRLSNFQRWPRDAFIKREFSFAMGIYTTRQGTVRPNIPPHLERAMTIFIEEMRSHLSFFEDQIASHSMDSSTNKRSSLDLDECIRCFHLIKGGAGFLLLKDISQTAHCAELLSRKLGSGETDYDVGIREIEAMLKQLRAQFESLTKV